MRISPTTHESIDANFNAVLSTLDRLATTLSSSNRRNNLIDSLPGMLETLPLATEEYALANNRVRNAMQYLSCSEQGAARWEINLVRRQLRGCSELQPREPRRRRVQRVS